MTNQQAIRDDGMLSAIGGGARRELLSAAIDAFAERGFHASTTREIGSRVGMSPAAVYVHYPSKTDLLLQISTLGHAAALADVEAALSGLKGPSARLRAFAATMAMWHAENHRMARVCLYELRSLPPDQRREQEETRKDFDLQIRKLIEKGVKSGEFEVPDVRGTAGAILSLCLDVARWYPDSSRLTPGEVGDLYGELAVRMTRPGLPD